MNDALPADALPTDVLPTAAVAHRLVQNLASHDQLMGLLDQVVAAYRFTNRLDEAVCLIPAAVMDEISTITALPLRTADPED